MAHRPHGELLVHTASRVAAENLHMLEANLLGIQYLSHGHHKHQSWYVVRGGRFVLTHAPFCLRSGENNNSSKTASGSIGFINTMPPHPLTDPFELQRSWFVVHGSRLATSPQDPNVEVKVGQDGEPVAYVSPPGSPSAAAAATAATNVEQQLPQQQQLQQQMQPGTLDPNANGPGGMPLTPGMQVNET